MSRGACRLLSALWLLSTIGGPATAQSREVWREMNRPVKPFRMLGNLYYVGASDVTSFLIATSEGHILIDGGFPETAPMIRDSIAALGFDVGDVRILLNSHAHFDHAGGLARLKEWSGAKLMASAEDAGLLERGGLGDDLLGDEAPFPPVRVDRRLADGDTVRLGEATLTARLTPGHTRGCTSWSFPVAHGDAAPLAVSVCSLTVLDGMRLTGESPTYPGIAADFRGSIAALRELPAEIFLASHGVFFGLSAKREALDAGAAPNPFLDAAGYRAYLDRAERRLQERLAAER